MTLEAFEVRGFASAEKHAGTVSKTGTGAAELPKLQISQMRPVCKDYAFAEEANRFHVGCRAHSTLGSDTVDLALTLRQVDCGQKLTFARNPIDRT